MKKTHHFLVILVAIVSINIQASPQPTVDTKLDKLFNSYTSQSLFRGSVLVVNDNKVIHHKGYGLADENWSIDNTSDTGFNINSIAKPLTATLILQLIERNELALTDSITSYFTELTHLPKDLTVQELLSHRSGISRELFTESSDYYKPHNSKELIDALKSVAVSEDKRGSYHYSNTGYQLLGLLVEKIYQQSFSDVLQQQILTPAKMTSTYVKSLLPPVGKRARHYDVSTGTTIEAFEGHPQAFFGAGGIVSTTGDLYRFHQALESNLLLSQKTRDLIKGTGKRYGLGWQIMTLGKKDNGEMEYGYFHNGDGDGSASHFFRSPDEGFVLILLSNQDLLPRNEILMDVAAVINDTELTYEKTNLVKELLPLVLENKFKEAIGAYMSMKSKKGVIGKINAIQMVRLGNQFLAINQLDYAERVFAFTTTAFPKNIWGYVASADLAEQRGQHQKAKSLYQKVLTLAPDQSHATQGLKRLAVLEQ